MTKAAGGRSKSGATKVAKGRIKSGITKAPR